MRNLLKYLIPIVMIVAFSNAAGGFDSSYQKSVSDCCPIETVEYSGFFSTPHSELGIPEQISLSCPTSVHSNVRRTVGTHRLVLEFIKSGKALNISVLYSEQRHSVIVNTSVIEHAHKLVYLGKLII